LGIEEGHHRLCTIFYYLVTAAQLIKRFFVIICTWRFNRLFTETRHWTLSSHR